MNTRRTKQLAGLMSGLLIFITLAISAGPSTHGAYEIRTLYIEFDFSDSDHPTSKIKYELKTSRIGEKDPFVPLAKIETRVHTKTTDFEWPGIGKKIAEWGSDSRSVILKLVDGEDIEGGEKRYWHFPEQNTNNTMPEEMVELAEHINETLKDLPEDMLRTLNERTNEIYGVGGAIDEGRRLELLELTNSALRDGGYAWVADMIGNQRGTLILRSSSGIGRLVGYIFGSFVIAGLWGVFLFKRLLSGEDGEEQEEG